MSGKEESPLVVPIAAVERDRLEDKHYRDNAAWYFFLGTAPPSPYLMDGREPSSPPTPQLSPVASLLTCWGCALLLVALLAFDNRWLWRAPSWSPPDAATWELAEGTLSKRWWPEEAALELAPDRYVDLLCAPELAGSWSCGRQYARFVRRHDGERVRLALAEDGRRDSWYVVVWAQTADGQTFRYGDLRPSTRGVVFRTLFSPFGVSALVALVVAVWVSIWLAVRPVSRVEA